MDVFCKRCDEVRSICVLTVDDSGQTQFTFRAINRYGRLKCRVRWNDAIGESFPVTCGVRQGGILSPYLFALYVDDVIIQLKNSDYGICIGKFLLVVCFMLTT